MMFLAGLAIGSVCGVCVMCIVSYKREKEYDKLMDTVARINAQSKLYDLAERERHINANKDGAE